MMVSHLDFVMAELMAHVKGDCLAVPMDLYWDLEKVSAMARYWVGR